MPESTRDLRIPLHILNRDRSAASRRGEPVVLGVSLPRGVVHSARRLAAVDDAGRPVPMDARVLDAWPDGSARWVACEMAVDAGAQTDTVAILCLRSEEPASPVPALTADARAGGVRVDTGRGVFELAAGRPFPFGAVTVDGVARLEGPSSGFTLDLDGQPLWIEISGAALTSVSGMRAVVQVRGAARGGAVCPLQIEARLEFFAGQATVRAEVTVRNPRPAQHPGGRWLLGDAGSILLRSFVCRLPVTGGVDEVVASIDSQTQCTDAPPFALHQESSGGDAWNNRVHCNSTGIVPLRYRGYRLRSGAAERSGLRASPVVRVTGPNATVDVAVPAFWQNFPKAIAVDRDAVVVEIFPADAAEPFELQGGEQKTHTLVVAFAPDTVTDTPLAWVHEPLLLSPAPDWTASTGAVPFLEPASRDPRADYKRLVETGLDPVQGFAAKQERADEYGWRNFGDLPADHESAFLTDGQVYVSHYNNQYDALACFAVHFHRTGDPRWHALMCDLAAHVRDIDIYHTTGDKSAYNGGLFWHTDHYIDAGTSTHRTYPLGSDGGGPSNEHNYNLGLLMHYLLTGDERSREAAIGLGEWVLNMDDGRQTIFRWLARGATGLASATGSSSYHGPGRGAANSILACLVAHRLTGEAKYAAKIEELIRRCVHPDDDLGARQLDDVERRWYYTVFLQVLGQFLYEKRERGELDEIFDYARASLLHYSRYIVEHEQPYLERADRLDFPTETWVAQDLRKGDALLWAAFFAHDREERARFLTRADGFFDYSLPTLLSMPTHIYTRPTILALSLGWRRAWYATNALPDVAPGPEARTWAGAAHFTPQKTVAMRRAAWLAAAALGAVIAAAVLFETLL